ncbi:MAG TPA: alpha/beta hydrolase [Solirubrobacteraceae bacterium]|nr:alpha/beta hydrolase [Solirubrobacteraceae bacterium]
MNPPGGGAEASGGATVLFFHGQPGSARDWTLVQAAIGDRLAMLAIDRPGWDGRTPAGGLGSSVAAGISALDGAGARRAVVVGLSFGGAVAASMAIQHPDRVAALVLISPAANTASLQPVDRLLALPIAGYAASAAVLAGAGVALASGAIRGRLERTFRLPDDYLRTASRRLRSPRAWTAFLVEQRALLAELPQLEERLGEIVAPTIVVLGTADTVVPLAAGRQLSRQIPHAELVEIPGGHHVLAAEHPERLAELILRAAERVQGADSHTQA